MENEMGSEMTTDYASKDATRPKFDNMPSVQDDTTVEPNQLTRSEQINNPAPIPAVNLRTGGSMAQRAASSTAMAAAMSPPVNPAGSPNAVTNGQEM